MESTTTSSTICPTCHFDIKADLYKHLRLVHRWTKEEVDRIKAERRRQKAVAAGKAVIACEICEAIFTNAMALRTHQRSKHPTDPEHTIICPICDEELKNHRELVNHARMVHAEEEDDYIVERLSFTDKQDFKTWKLASEEANVISRFTSATKQCGNTKTTYLRCNAAHRQTSKIPAKTSKAVRYCTAYMNIVEGEDSISVEHCLKHCGHEGNPAKLRLDENARKHIASMLKEGLTVRQVYNTLRTKLRGPTRTRLYFTTTRDIRNIATKCCVQPGRLHSLDTLSVQKRVETNAESDGIQHYTPAKNASGDGFVLVIINPTQREWLRKYGQRSLSLDDTFNLTSYSLRLTTIIVADEWDRGLPAAYLLSFRMTEVEVGILFNCVKKFLPSFHTDYFMTDDTNTFWNGYRQAYPSSGTKRLLCLWHVQQAIKRNASSKLLNTDLMEPFMRKLREVCLIRDRSTFVTKYSSLLKHLRDQGETTLASYMENSWSDRVEHWAAFGRLGSCVNTSMLCERFHKALKHDILGGKANVRIDSLMHLLIGLTVEKEEEREIMMARGVEEGRYRLQHHHKAHASALIRYAERQEDISVTGDGQWQVEDNNKVFTIQEHFCPCHPELNNHCRRGDCKACPYAFVCSCPMDVKSGISCLHVHAALTYAPQGCRTNETQSQESASSSSQLIMLDSSDEEQDIAEIYVEDDDLENVPETPARRRSADDRDFCRDMFQKLEMECAALRTYGLDAMKAPTENVREAFPDVIKYLQEANKIMATLAGGMARDSAVRLARRTEIPTTGRPQGHTPIRKLHKRSHLRKNEKAKRNILMEIQDCEADDRDTCAVCLRMEPVVGSGSSHIRWIQCPTCDDWLHMSCVNNVCPKDGTLLEADD